MKQENTREIKRRSVHGVIVTGFVQAIALLGGFILSIVGSTELFGVFAVVGATAAFLAYFSDIGLAAALIQKKKDITKQDLATTFTIQQVLVIVLVVLALYLSNWIGSTRGFDEDALWLFRALVLSFFLSSLKTIPSILLERELRFKKLAIPQLLEVVSFNIVIIYLVLNGWGIRMFTIAVLVRSFIGLVSIYMINPWMPRIGIYRESARRLISFGIPFQLNSLVALVKDQLFIMFLPLILPIGEIGYINWAKKWSEVPLRLVMDNVIRVTFPTYSRLQSDESRLKKGVNKTTFFLMFAIIPMSVGIVFILEPLMALIPCIMDNGEKVTCLVKWEPALASFYLFVIASTVAGISTPLINALNAIGKIKISLYFMVFWTAFTWAVAPFLVQFIGFNAIAMTSALMSLTVIAVILVARRYIKFNLSKQMTPALVGSLIMGLVLFATKELLTSSLLLLAVYVALGVFVYGGSLMLLFRKKVITELTYISNIMRDK